MPRPCPPAAATTGTPPTGEYAKTAAEITAAVFLWGIPAGGARRVCSQSGEGTCSRPGNPCGLPPYTGVAPFSSVRLYCSGALRFCDPHSFFSALSKRKNAPRRCKKEKTPVGDFLQSRPPHPLLNLEVGKITPGNCRAIIRMGSGTAGPLALGRHGTGAACGRGKPPPLQT